MSNRAEEFCLAPLSSKVQEPSPEFFLSPSQIPDAIQSLLDPTTTTTTSSTLSTEH
ncbi:MAG: hypothetical protein WAW39_12745 [Prosthecobacter sp.]|uniref:hypothetical protein n=1 Tax=Prosthecobacter sp. TaxID=1965333 RepID=UPI003BB162BD